MIIAAIVKEWYRCYNGDPKTDDHFFFANPVTITLDGPTTITGILNTHRAFCDQASSIFERMSREELDDRFGDRWLNPLYYTIHPLFRAIIVIHDERLCDESFEAINHDGFLHLDEFLEAQSVLLVRTGDESGLSGPISFKGLSDRASDKIDVRVSLGTAVKFIVSLEKREEAFSRPKAIELTPDKGGPETRETYAASVLRRAAQRCVFSE